MGIRTTTTEIPPDILPQTITSDARLITQVLHPCDGWSTCVINFTCVYCSVLLLAANNSAGLCAMQSESDWRCFKGCAISISHGRPQDFFSRGGQIQGCKKVDDLFSRRPQNTDLSQGCTFFLKKVDDLFCANGYK